jgi:hypoxanthine-guanine phosphoribosyltransferase
LAALLLLAAVSCVQCHAHQTLLLLQRFPIPSCIHDALESILQGKAPVLMPILKGGFIFAADLIRALDPCPEDLVVEFVSAR